MKKKPLPQYAELEQPFGCDPPIMHCPICGNPTLTVHEDVGSEWTPCAHLAFIYMGEMGEFVVTSEGFTQRTADLDTEDLSFETFRDFLQEAGYENQMLAIEITYGGMGHGPVWYTDIYGFDFGQIGQEGSES